MSGRPEPTFSRPDFLATEDDRIIAWRLFELMNAGYPVNVAEHLAIDFDVDLHEACELVANGCPPETAREILT